jgi:hypothetical protein
MPAPTSATRVQCQPLDSAMIHTNAGTASIQPMMNAVSASMNMPVRLDSRVPASCPSICNRRPRASTYKATARNSPDALARSSEAGGVPGFMGDCAM